jgi:hypothetical protein
LLPAFQGAYEQRYPYELTRAGTLRQRRAGGGAKGVLQRLEDTLLFLVLSQKTHPLQTMHALQCEMSQPPANDGMHPLRPVLHHALAALGHAPERAASRLATRPLILAGAPATAIDGTARRRQRPRAPQLHQEHDSGKQKAHTDKNLLWVNEMTHKVVYLGPTIAGRRQDQKAADEATRGSPTNATLDKDTGLQGYEPDRVLTTQPQKSPKAAR